MTRICCMNKPSVGHGMGQSLIKLTTADFKIFKEVSKGVLTLRSGKAGWPPGSESRVRDQDQDQGWPTTTSMLPDCQLQCRPSLLVLQM